MKRVGGSLWEEDSKRLCWIATKQDGDIEKKHFHLESWLFPSIINGNSWRDRERKWLHFGYASVYWPWKRINWFFLCNKKKIGAWNNKKIEKKAGTCLWLIEWICCLVLFVITDSWRSNSSPRTEERYYIRVDDERQKDIKMNKSLMPGGKQKCHFSSFYLDNLDGRWESQCMRRGDSI